MELTEIINEVKRLQSEEERLGEKTEQMRAERSRHSSEYYRQIDLMEKNEKEEEQQYHLEARQVESEQGRVKVKKENYFDQLCALYSNSQGEEIKDAVTQIGDKELIRKIEVQERCYSLNEILKEKSSHIEVSWDGGSTCVRTVNSALDVLIEKSQNSTILKLKKDAVKIPEITIYGEKVYLVSSTPLKEGVKYGYREKRENSPEEYTQEIFRSDPYNSFQCDNIGKLHLFSAPPVKNEQLEWLGLLVKQAIVYQEKEESMRAELSDTSSDCCGD